MKSSYLDNKVMELTEICTTTHNFNKLATVAISLISNQLNIIGIELGLRPRKIDHNELLYQYMLFIQEVVYQHFNFKLFEEEWIDKLRGIEMEFSRKKGNLIKEYIKSLNEIYYELRKLDLPDLAMKVKKIYPPDVDMIQNSLNISKETKSKSNNQFYLNSLLLNRLKREEDQLEEILKENYSKANFEQLIQLKAIKTQLQKKSNSKIQISGKLKNNVVYTQTLNFLFGYLFLGIAIVGILLGLIITIELMLVGIYFTTLPGDYNFLVVLFFGVGFLFIFLYNRFFMIKK